MAGNDTRNNLFDIIKQAAGGKAVDLLAQIGGVPAEEAERMIADTLPALSTGLKRTAQSPQGLAQIVSLALQGDADKFITQPDARAAVAPEPGFALMETVFGGAQKAEQAQHIVADKARSDTRAANVAIPVIAAAAIGAIAYKVKTDPELQAKLRDLLGLAEDKALDMGAGIRDLADRAREIVMRAPQAPEVKSAPDLTQLGGLFDADKDGKTSMDELWGLLGR